MSPPNEEKTFLWLWRGNRLLFAQEFSLNDYGIKSNDTLYAIQVSRIRMKAYTIAHTELKLLGETNLLDPLTVIELQ